ncbi:phosphatases II [Wallemia mellicola]|nr:phosphatases II [Wallemia mellicola]
MEIDNEEVNHTRVLLENSDGFDGGSDWRYEMRRECQEIIPNLVLGPYQCSKDTAFLTSAGITHIVVIRGEAEAVFVRPRYPDQFSYLVLDVRDSEEQNLIRIYPDRGPAITIMYVMEAAQVSFEDATNYVQNKRYCISPNLGFQCQLKEFEAIYRASLAIANQPTLTRDSKRRLEDDDSIEADIDARPSRNQRV